MNRAQRRQLDRALRREAKHPQQRIVVTEAAPEVVDAAARQSARAHGLIVPPSMSELERARGAR